MSVTAAAEAVLILGNPNSGKSLLFNRLTGLSQKVANFPGVTVEVRSGHGEGLLFQDYPGLYSLDALTQDEVAAIRGFRAALYDPLTRCVLYTVDATRLQRSLFLLLQLQEELRPTRIPLVVAINIIDEVIGRGATLDVQGLAAELACPVLAVSAKTGQGLAELRACVRAQSTQGKEPQALTAASTVIALKARAADLAGRFGPQSDLLLKSQNRLDHFFLSGLWGPLAFVALMLFLFQAIFSWATPLMDAVEGALGFVGEWSSARLPAGAVGDFVKDAVFGGMGAFLVFVPQIFVLFVIIGMLEDSGYLARAAVLCHRPLSYFGLSGRSFVPLLSGHACAIPAIMSARTIESPRRRLLTYLAVPFMSCSARLPVYALLIGAFVPAQVVLGGLLGLQGLAFFLLYLFGIMMGLLVAGISSRTILRARENDAPFIVELPPYRWPSWRSIVRQSLTRMLAFVKRAGGVIFAVTVVVWFLGYFPHGAGHLNESYLGQLGRWIEPVFKPMGMDWKIGVGVLSSFLAREVFVGTLGTLYGIENADDAGSAALAEQLQASGMTLATAVALMVFYALAMQCVSTLAVIKSESGKHWLASGVFVGYTILAYVCAMLAYRLISA